MDKNRYVKGIVYFFFWLKIALPLTHSFWFNAVYYFWWYIFFFRIHSLILEDCGIFFYQLMYFFTNWSIFCRLCFFPKILFSVIFFSLIGSKTKKYTASCTNSLRFLRFTRKLILTRKNKMYDTFAPIP